MSVLATVALVVAVAFGLLGQGWLRLVVAAAVSVWCMVWLVRNSEEEAWESGAMLAVFGALALLAVIFLVALP